MIDDCFYYHSWRNNVVIAFETLSSSWFSSMRLHSHQEICRSRCDFLEQYLYSCCQNIRVRCPHQRYLSSFTNLPIDCVCRSENDGLSHKYNISSSISVSRSVSKNAANSGQFDTRCGTHVHIHTHTYTHTHTHARTHTHTHKHRHTRCPRVCVCGLRNTVSGLPQQVSEMLSITLTQMICMYPQYPLHYPLHFPYSGSPSKNVSMSMCLSVCFLHL